MKIEVGDTVELIGGIKAMVLYVDYERDSLIIDYKDGWSFEETNYAMDERETEAKKNAKLLKARYKKGWWHGMDCVKCIVEKYRESKIQITVKE